MRPRVRTRPASGYAGLARVSGLDPVALLASVGLDVADLDVLDRWIPAAPVARLLEARPRSGRSVPTSACGSPADAASAPWARSLWCSGRNLTCGAPSRS